MRYGDAIIQGMCPIFGMYSSHKLHVHKFVRINSLTDFISFGIEFHIWFELYPNVSRLYDTVLGFNYDFHLVNHEFLEILQWRVIEYFSDGTIFFKKSFKTRHIIVICYPKCPFMNFNYQSIRLTLTIHPDNWAIIKLGYNK